jgi:hypothetical protein
MKKPYLVQGGMRDIPHTYLLGPNVQSYQQPSRSKVSQSVSFLRGSQIKTGKSGEKALSKE